MAEYNPEEWPWQDPVAVMDECYVYEDAYAVTPGHLLFIPKDNGANSVMRTLGAAFRWANNQRSLGKLEAFNIGMNQGFAAGQTVDWPHVHMIPRTTGDMEDPRGGVRHVIPERGNYKLDGFKPI